MQGHVWGLYLLVFWSKKYSKYTDIYQKSSVARHNVFSISQAWWRYEHGEADEPGEHSTPGNGHRRAPRWGVLQP